MRTEYLVLLCIGAIAAQERGWVGGSRAKSRDHDNHLPVFKDTNRNITASPGKRAVLKCRVENLGTKTVTWKRADQEHPLTIGLFPFVSDTRVTVDYNQRTLEWVLIIQDVKPDDEGIYQCQISTKHQHDKLSYDVKLNVDTVQVTGEDFVERGSTLKLVCNATGKPVPPHDVAWFKDGRKIESDVDSGKIITKKIDTKVLVSMLVIQRSAMSDQGEYECKSTENDSAKITVKILDVQAPVGKRRTSSAVTGMGRNSASSSLRFASTPSSFASSSSLLLSVMFSSCLSLTTAFVVRWT